MTRVLIAEDDKAISDLLKLNLDLLEFESIQAYDGETALKELNSLDFDLVLLDIMLPKIDGFEIIKKIRDDIPVIFITAKDSLLDKVNGLKLGADDYLVKPFEMLELLARIEAVLRRYDSNPKDDNKIMIKNITILQDERVAKLNDECINLTHKEFELLIMLVKNKGIALSRDLILKKIWGYDYYGESRTVDMHIQRLRKKLDFEDEIKTVYKYGYRLEI